MEESPITAAISHDPIANSSMIQPEKNDRRDATLRLSRNRNSSEYDSASFSLSRVVQGKGTCHGTSTVNHHRRPAFSLTRGCKLPFACTPALLAY